MASLARVCRGLCCIYAHSCRGCEFFAVSCSTCPNGGLRDLNRMNKSVERLAISLTSVSAVTVAHDSITDNSLSPEELRTRVKEAAPLTGGGVKSQVNRPGFSGDSIT